MKNMRMLLVEDDKDLASFLKASYRQIFEDRGFHLTVEEAGTVEEARRLAKAAHTNPYDFVSLDVDLGDATMTGLDILKTLGRFQSAWMVSLLTGIETSVTVDETMGHARGETLRKQLRRDAYANFPAERLLVVEKPAEIMGKTEAKTLLQNRLKQIAAVYEEVSRLRYVFRPIEVVSRERVGGGGRQRRERQFTEVTSIHWQIRFDCGDMRTLKDRTWFKTLHHLLSLDREGTLSPEEALVIEPRTVREQPVVLQTAPAGEVTPVSRTTQAEKLAQYFIERGINWSKLSPESQDDLIRAALSVQLKRYIELRGFLDEEGLETKEEEELSRLKVQFGPLVEKAEEAYQMIADAGISDEAQPTLEEMTPGVRAQNELHAGGRNVDREPGRWAEDTPEAELFRARKKRACDYLRENGFSDFAQHIEEYVQPGAKWSYNPPSGIEWTV